MTIQNVRSLIDKLDSIVDNENLSQRTITEHLDKYAAMVNEILAEMNRREFMGNVGKGLVAAGAALAGLPVLAKSNNSQIPKEYSPREWQQLETLAIMAGTLQGVRIGLGVLQQQKKVSGEQIDKTKDLLFRTHMSTERAISYLIQQKNLSPKLSQEHTKRLYDLAEWHTKDCVDIMKHGDARSLMDKSMDFVRQLVDAGIAKY